jgi:hypothetical protein
MPSTSNRVTLRSTVVLPTAAPPYQADQSGNEARGQGCQTAARPYQADQSSPAKFEPLLVTATSAKEILQIGNTKFWRLVKLGKIQMAETAGRRMVVYASLKALAQPSV